MPHPSPPLVLGSAPVAVQWAEAVDVDVNDLATVSIIDEDAGTTNVIHATAPVSEFEAAWSHWGIQPMHATKGRPRPANCTTFYSEEEGICSRKWVA